MLCAYIAHSAYSFESLSQETRYTRYASTVRIGMNTAHGTTFTKCLACRHIHTIRTRNFDYLMNQMLHQAMKESSA
jgi:hypothetical protein